MITESNNIRIDSLEPLPAHYRQPEDSNEMYTVASIEGMVCALRDELETDSFGDIVENAYYVSREIGDRALVSADKSHRVMDLLEATRVASRPSVFKLDSSIRHGGQFESGDGGMIVVQPHMAEDNYVEVVSDLESKGVTMRHPSDARVIWFLKLTAHESGHALLDGVSRVIHAINEGPNFSYRPPVAQLASTAYMANHPEKAFSGSWTSDIRIQEERFAEGYGLLVASKAIEALGYDDNERATILQALKYQEILEGDNHGDNQIDHLTKKPSSESLSSQVPGDALSLRKYDGLLGYTKPLDVRELVEELSELSDGVENKDVSTDVNPEWWAGAVGTFRAERNVRNHLRDIKDRRANKLDPLLPEKRARLKRAIRNGAAALALTSTIMMAGGTTSSNSEHDVNVQHSIDQAEKDHPMIIE